MIARRAARLVASVLCLTVAASLVVATTSAAAAKKPVVRTMTKTFKVAVPATSGTTIGYFDYDQRTSTQCKPKETSLAPGIVSTTHYVAGHSFGPAAVSAFLVGPAGTATAKLQALCVTGGKIVHKRVPAKTVPGLGGTVGGDAAGRATATANCGVGTVAVGAPLSQEFAPGLGSFSSTPFGARGWKVVVNGVVDQLTAGGVVAGYADVSCVKAKAVLKKTLPLTLAADGTASGKVTCVGGRRALGWGVELGSYSTRFPSNGLWNTPMVKQAWFNPTGTTVTFAFGMPAGATAPSTVGGTPVTAHVVCGVLVA